MAIDLNNRSIELTLIVLYLKDTTSRNIFHFNSGFILLFSKGLFISVNS